MANVTEYLAPIKIVYTTDYSGGSAVPLIINSVDELIEITPVAFDREPTTANLRALPDNCKIKVKETGIYVLCIATNGYGTCAAEVGVSLFPCFVTDYGLMSFKYGNTLCLNSGLEAGMFDYLCVYKQTDNRGLRISRFGTYSFRPENNWNYPDNPYSVANVQPGAYVPYKVPQESGATVIYNAEEIARLEQGQTATLSCSGKKMTSDVIVSFATAGSITYNELITEVEAGKTATLQCAGKKMTGDVYVTVQKAADELAGTWVLNATLVLSKVKQSYAVNGTYHTLNIDNQLIEVEFDIIGRDYYGSNSWVQIQAKDGYTADNNVFNVYYTSGSSMALTGSIRVQYGNRYDRRIPNTDANFVALRTFTITSNLADVKNGAALLEWLQANATKQS